MRIDEVAATREFYHGSYEVLPVGTVLTPRSSYEDRWGSTDFYPILEKYRPREMLSHRESIFMCDNPDDLDAAGAATEWLFTVMPIGRVERHDLNWGSEISVLAGDAANEEAIAEAAHNYWRGVPHRNEPVWEYLTPQAKIVAVEEY